MATQLASGIVKKSSSYFADPAQLVEREGFNPRFDMGDLDELKASIIENGVMQPLRVRRNEDGKLEVIDGHRRMTSIKQLLAEGFDFADGVPIILDKPTEVEAITIMLTANSGKPFLPLEEAAAYKRMVDSGLTIAEVAKKLGRSEVHVKDRISLLSAAPEVKKALEDGKIGSTLAENIVNSSGGDEQKQKELVEKATESKEGKKEVQQKVEGRKREPKSKPTESPVLPQEKLEAELKDYLEKLRQAAEAEGMDPEKAANAEWLGINGRMAAFNAGVVEGLMIALGRL